MSRLALALTLAACSSASTETCEQPVSLIDPLAWRQIDAPDAGEAPDAGAAPDAGLPRCGPENVRSEMFGPGKATLTIETDGCSGATVEQPATIAVAAGEPLDYRVWHFPLDRFGPAAEGHSIITLDGIELVHDVVPLPAAEGGLLFNEAGPLPCPIDLPAGAPIRWQVSNHGENSWNFLELSVGRPLPCSPDAAAP